MRILRSSWPYGVGALVAYSLLGLGVLAVRGSGNDVPDLAFACLLMLNPAVAVVVAGLCGYRHGLNPLVPVVIGIAFVPVAYVFFNSSALIYAVAYALVAAIGLPLGRVLRAAYRRGRTA